MGNGYAQFVETEYSSGNCTSPKSNEAQSVGIEPHCTYAYSNYASAAGITET